MKSNYELVVIGAGPAGMAAACAAAERGVSVCVLDDQPQAGGQIYRNVGQANGERQRILGADYSYGKNLLERFQAYGQDYFANASVWYIDGDNQIGVVYQQKTYFIQPDKVIIATGAQERAMPIAGWQLPGVLYAGAGQILLKASGLKPKGELILAGSGPLLLLLASQYLKAGVNIKAILDTTPKGRTMGALGKLWKGLQGYAYLLKGVALMAQIKRAGIPYYRHVTGLSAQGDEALAGVTFTATKGVGAGLSEVTLRADTLMLHQGVIPNTRIAQAAECPTYWDDEQLCWAIKTDAMGLARPNTYVIGDGARIKGAKAAELEGRLSGCHVANQLAKLGDVEFHQQAKQLLQEQDKHLALRPFLDAVYRPAQEYLSPADENVIVCRCEEVTVADIKRAVDLGCLGPNQVKSFTRCGMGPCQSGQCSNTLTQVIAEHRQQPITEVGKLRVRAPLSPVTLGQIAELDD